jgi:hypothetical protein
MLAYAIAPDDETNTRTTAQACLNGYQANRAVPARRTRLGARSEGEYCV